MKTQKYVAPLLSSLLVPLFASAQLSDAQSSAVSTPGEILTCGVVGIRPSFPWTGFIHGRFLPVTFRDAAHAPEFETLAWIHEVGLASHSA